jgi:hypothetical protein
MRTATTTTGHKLTIDGLVLQISGELDTMQDIPDAEIEATCAAAGLRCTYEPVSPTSYRLEPLTLCAEELS